MAMEQLIMTLAKVLIAAAWADGELTHDEVNSMKDLLFFFPQLSARQWASLAIYLEAPVGEAERARLVEDLRNAIRSEAHKELVRRTLDEMVNADGQVTEEEAAVVARIKAAIESVDVGLLATLVRGMTRRRSQALANAPNREDYFDDFVKNKVYYGMRRRLDLGQADLDLPEDTLRTLCLAGGVMAQIAHVNPDVGDAEVSTMVDALQTHWHLTPQQAAFVVDVAISETASLLDRYRLAREFAGACRHQERVEFLDVLFALAAADGMATYEEVEEIRQVARSLKLSHKEFITAKLKIPRDRRAQ
jgi:uncharacterized tellurite resistance protein B-like protein